MKIWIVVLVAMEGDFVQEDAGYFLSKEAAEAWIADEAAKQKPWLPSLGDYKAVELSPAERDR